VGFVILGTTKGMSSAVVIGRYKTAGEIKDLLIGDAKAAKRAARRGLHVFERCMSTEECLYLVSFDIKAARVRGRSRTGRSTKRPGDEYVKVREMLYMRLCGTVDLSTYVCTEDVASDVERYLNSVASGYHIVRLYVRPWRDEDRELVRESVQRTLDWVTGRARTVATRVASVAPQGYGIVRKRAVEFLDALAKAKETAKKLEARLAKMGVEVRALQAIVDAEKSVVEALRRREELRQRV